MLNVQVVIYKRAWLIKETSIYEETDFDAKTHKVTHMVVSNGLRLMMKAL
jgi:hypothetical protein